jgi:hypothetical protein
MPVPVAALVAVALAQAGGAEAPERMMSRIEARIAGVETALHERLGPLESRVQELAALLASRERIEPVAAPFLASPPPSSDLVGVAPVPVFAPRVGVDSPARHDIVFLTLHRLEPDGAQQVGGAELTESGGEAEVPIDRNGALYVMEWTTAQGHEYELVLRDGLSGRIAASVKVGPYDRDGRFVFVGYGPGVPPLDRR